jgi:hypothetical protein
VNGRQELVRHIDANLPQAHELTLTFATGASPTQRPKPEIRAHATRGQARVERAGPATTLISVPRLALIALSRRSRWTMLQPQRNPDPPRRFYPQLLLARRRTLVSLAPWQAWLRGSSLSTSQDQPRRRSRHACRHCCGPTHGPGLKGRTLFLVVLSPDVLPKCSITLAAI